MKLRDQVKGFVSPENKEALDNSVGKWQTSMTPNSKLRKENYLADIQNFLE